MNLKTLAFALPLAALAACGTTDTVYTLTSGTYGVTGATTTAARPTDQCGILAAYQEAGKAIGITVVGTTATFNLANDPSAPAISLPTATITDNAIDVLAEANYLAGPFGNDCLLRIHRRVSGELTADNEARLELTFESARESGTCDPLDLPFTAAACSSGYEFLVKRAP